MARGYSPELVLRFDDKQLYVKTPGFDYMKVHERDHDTWTALSPAIITKDGKLSLAKNHVWFYSTDNQIRFPAAPPPDRAKEVGNFSIETVKVHANSSWFIVVPGKEPGKWELKEPASKKTQ